MPDMRTTVGSIKYLGLHPSTRAMLETHHRQLTKARTVLSAFMKYILEMADPGVINKIELKAEPPETEEDVPPEFQDNYAILMWCLLNEHAIGQIIVLFNGGKLQTPRRTEMTIPRDTGTLEQWYVKLEEAVLANYIRLASRELLAEVIPPLAIAFQELGVKSGNDPRAATRHVVGRITSQLARDIQTMMTNFIQGYTAQRAKKVIYHQITAKCRELIEQWASTPIKTQNTIKALLYKVIDSRLYDYDHRSNTFTGAAAAMGVIGQEQFDTIADQVYEWHVGSLNGIPHVEAPQYALLEYHVALYKLHGVTFFAQGDHDEKDEDDDGDNPGDDEDDLQANMLLRKWRLIPWYAPKASFFTINPSVLNQLLCRTPEVASLAGYPGTGTRKAWIRRNQQKVWDTLFPGLPPSLARSIKNGHKVAETTFRTDMISVHWLASVGTVKSTKGGR